MTTTPVIILLLFLAHRLFLPVARSTQRGQSVVVAGANGLGKMRLGETVAVRFRNIVIATALLVLISPLPTNRPESLGEYPGGRTPQE